jgi:hypothetical protein
MLFTVAFVLLIKDAERIVFEGFLLANNYFAAVETFPPFKIKKVIKERLQDHQATTFFTLHTVSFFCNRLLNYFVCFMDTVGLISVV